MNEETYLKREIDGFHGHIDEKLGKIDEKLTIQNGRVASLEKWQSFIMGGLAVLSLITLPILFILLRSWIM